jgi:hypothetical protein
MINILMHIEDPKLFIRKILTLLAVTVVLVPLIHFKMTMPAAAYIAALLVLHLYILYVYCNHLPWRKLLQNRVGFGLRLSGVVLFAYILTLLHYEGTELIVLASVGAAVAIHTAILLLLMSSANAKDTTTSTTVG